jgi:hypothetical protein
MKLANALAQRADLQRRMAQLGSRLMNNAKVQEGEQPAEDPKALLAEMENVSAELEELICRINLTNTAARSDTGESLTALLARRDCLKMKLGLYREFLQTASDVVPRGLRTEIRIVSTVKVSQMQKQVDDMSRDLRLLEETIQGLNWTTELQ